MNGLEARRDDKLDDYGASPSRWFRRVTLLSRDKTAAPRCAHLTAYSVLLAVYGVGTWSWAVILSHKVCRAQPCDKLPPARAGGPPVVRRRGRAGMMHVARY